MKACESERSVVVGSWPVCSDYGRSIWDSTSPSCSVCHCLSGLHSYFVCPFCPILLFHSLSQTASPCWGFVVGHFSSSFLSLSLSPPCALLSPPCLNSDRCVIEWSMINQRPSSSTHKHTCAHTHSAFCIPLKNKPHTHRHLNFYFLTKSLFVRLFMHLFIHSELMAISFIHIEYA